MTLLELWAASRNPPAHIEPWEISAELNGRLVRILTLPLLPLMAIPLAIDRVRGQRSYGLVVGLAMLIAFHQLLQVGEALADNNKIPIWAGLWLPFAVFAAISAWMFVRAATQRARPAPGHLARPAVRPPGPAAAAAAAPRRCADERSRPLPQPHVPRALPGGPVRDHRLRHRHRPDRRRPRAGARTRGCLRRGRALFRPAAADHAVRAHAAGGPAGRAPGGRRPAAPPRADRGLEHRGAPAEQFSGCSCRRAWPWSRSSSRSTILRVPQATSELRLWGIGDYRHRPTEGGGGRLLLAAQRAGHRPPLGQRDHRRQGQRHLDLPPRHGRHPDRAHRRRLGHGHPGRLAPARRHRARRSPTASSSGLATLDWPGKIDVERIQLLARPPRELGLGTTCGTSSRPAATACARRSPT